MCMVFSLINNPLETTRTHTIESHGNSIVTIIFPIPFRDKDIPRKYKCAQEGKFLGTASFMECYVVMVGRMERVERGNSKSTSV